MIGKLLCFGAGLALGWVTGWFMKKNALKEEKKQAQLEEETTIKENEKIKEDFDQARKEVHQVLEENHYSEVVEDEEYEEEIEEPEDSADELLEEYLSQMEYPEDDIPEVHKPQPLLQQFTEDEFYTTNQDYEKTILYFVPGLRMYDRMGDDYLDFFRDNGYSSEKLENMFMNARCEYLYFTAPKRQCDYEIYLEEPDEGPI